MSVAIFVLMVYNQAMERENGKGFWNAVAAFYRPFMKKNSRGYDLIARELDAYLEKEMRVLELACGTGQISFRVASRVERYIATDFSENMVKRAEKRCRIPSLSFQVADATDLDFEDGSFDMVIIANALHIMPHPEKAVKEIGRVLKKGGILCAPTFVGGFFPKYSIREKLLSTIGFRTYSEWDEKAFVSFIESFGYTILSHRTVDAVPAPECILFART